MIAHVLLHGSVHPQMRSNIRVDLVQRALDLPLEAAAPGSRSIACRTRTIRAAGASPPEPEAGREAHPAPCGRHDPECADARRLRRAMSRRMDHLFFWGSRKRKHPCDRLSAGNMNPMDMDGQSVFLRRRSRPETRAFVNYCGSARQPSTSAQIIRSAPEAWPGSRPIRLLRRAPSASPYALSSPGFSPGRPTPRSAVFRQSPPRTGSP